MVNIVLDIIRNVFNGLAAHNKAVRNMQEVVYTPEQYRLFEKYGLESDGGNSIEEARGDMSLIPRPTGGFPEIIGSGSVATMSPISSFVGVGSCIMSTGDFDFGVERSTPSPIEPEPLKIEPFKETSVVPLSRPLRDVDV